MNQLIDVFSFSEIRIMDSEEIFDLDSFGMDDSFW